MQDNLPEDTISLVDTAQHKVIAAMLISGTTPNAIAKELKITRYHLGKILKDEDFKAMLKEVGEDLASQAVSVFKGHMQSLIPEALRVLRVKLEQNDLEAVKVVIKSIGLDKQEATQQNGALTIVMPDLSGPKEVKSEVIDG